MERRNRKTKEVGNGEGTLYKSEALNCLVFQYWHNGKDTHLNKRKMKKIKILKLELQK